MHSSPALFSLIITENAGKVKCHEQTAQTAEQVNTISPRLNLLHILHSQRCVPDLLNPKSACAKKGVPEQRC
jgi:hypothetical protein